mmetsp:Transcript_24751/g.41861  ORF Transcript_24751/g.41861 Transcript_24751/m.41861 type:complete len:398 (+) Transcript_24751:69-1262(+)
MLLTLWFAAVLGICVSAGAQGSNHTVGAWIAKRRAVKARKLSALVTRVLDQERSHADAMRDAHFDWSAAHRPDSQFAIFAISLKDEVGMKGVQGFVGTARKAGFAGDIVLATHPKVHKGIQKYLYAKRVSVYGVDVKCSGKNPTEVCQLPAEFGAQAVPIAMLRFYIYQWWASLYQPAAVIMLSDFRDVFFQANPFAYKYYEWRPPEHQLTVFQEFFPNKVISRCGHNRRWIRNCYGAEGLAMVETNTVLCSGTTFGTRDAVLGYASLMLRQLDAKVRLKGDAVDEQEANDQCYFQGMDQGLHNWLVYTGLLDMYMDVKVYQQGEGPVNTVGAFTGKMATLKRPLRDWGVLTGEAPQAVVLNWNQEPSPVVHQLDRFQSSEDIKGGYRGTMKAFQDL